MHDLQACLFKYISVAAFHICAECGEDAAKKRILGECLLISSLPGKVLRTLVDIARLAERFNMRSQSRAW